MNENESQEQRDQDELQREIIELRHAIEALSRQKFFKMHSSWGRFIMTSLVRGLFVGLGSVIGATLLLYFVIQFLSNIDFIPIIGEWAKEIVNIINGNGSRNRF